MTRLMSDDLTESLFVNPLQELISTRLAELDLSQRGASQRAAEFLNPNTIGRIMRGETIRVTDTTVQGLALALDIPLSRARKAADATARPEQFAEMAENFAKLSPDLQAKVLRAMQDAMAEHEAAERRRRAESPRSKLRRK